MTSEENKNSENIEGRSVHGAGPRYMGKAEAVFLLLFVPSFSGMAIFITTLTTGHLMPAWSSLYIIYFGYCACTLIFLHAVFFELNRDLRHRGSKFRKKVPKFIEYAYAALISVSLLQIFFSAERVADYLNLLAGDDQKIWAQIRDGARAHVTNECSKPVSAVWPSARPDPFLENFRKDHFTEEYCKEMQRIAEASDIKGYVFGTVIHNTEFLTHSAQLGMTLTGDLIETPSPIVPMMQLMYSREEYRKLPVNNVTGNAFAWIGLLLLPVGIALRVVKTSLELFGRLD
jgi:hypothetical protein